MKTVILLTLSLFFATHIFSMVKAHNGDLEIRKGSNTCEQFITGEGSEDSDDSDDSDDSNDSNDSDDSDDSNNSNIRSKLGSTQLLLTLSQANALNNLISKYSKISIDIPIGLSGTAEIDRYRTRVQTQLMTELASILTKSQFATFKTTYRPASNDPKATLGKLKAISKQ